MTSWAEPPRWAYFRPPTENRSFMSVVMAQRQPSFSAPTRWSSATRTSSRKTSANLACPVICLSGRMVTPVAARSTMNIVSPACRGRLASLRASTSPYCEISAPDVHTFWPVIVQASPSRTARVRRPARSEPAPGSEKTCDQISSPWSIGGT